MVFNISIWDELYPKIVEEATIRDRDKQWYLIKQIDAGSETAKVVAQLDLDAWKGAMLVGYSNNSSTLQDTINGITPTGWTLIDSSGISIRRTIEGDYTPLEIVEQCRDTYGVYFRFDNVAQTVTVVVPDEAQPLGAFATRDLNLKEINYKGKSTTFATRLYAYGADGLSFASINGGLPYVDDHTYSDKIVCAVWRDDRYTIAENLLEDAKKNLAAMAKPSRSYDCDVVDLAATNPDLYSIQDFSIFRVATLIDDAKDFAINYQIVERWNYPYYPEKNKVIFSSSPAKIQNQLQQITHQVESPNSPFRQQQQAAINNATQWLTNGEGYVVVRKRADGSTQDILFMDTPDIATAADVLRIGQSGIGFSHSGVNGPYTSAWTIDGSFVADFITAGTLNANLIRAGILQDVEGKAFYLDLPNGVLRMNATELSISGAPAASQSYAQQQAQAAQQAAIQAAAQSLSNYAETVTASLDDLQQQVDGQITTYFYDYKPTNNNAPASEWTTVEEMRRHAGDLFYNTSNGDAYRWAQNYGTWQWLEIVDTDVAAALAAAAAAQDTADSKRRVFTARPVPPYDVGDLWAEENNGPLQVCITAKASGAAFAAADWTDAANYTAQAAEAGRNLISNTQLLGVTSSNSWADVSDCTVTYDTTDDSNYYIVRLSATDYALQNLRGKTVTLSYQVKIDREITYGTEHTPALFTLRVDIEFADGSSQSIHPDYEIHTDDVANIIATQPTNGWVTKTKTAEVQDKEIESVTLKYIFQYIAGAAAFRYAKLEFGEIATPWSPAPEDTAIAAEAPALDQLGTFNKLTNNGQLQGIYMSGGQLYINGSYIRAGTIDASQVNVTNLNADNIKSGTITGRTISGGTITGTTITGSSVRSTSNSGSVLVDQGRVSLYDPSGKTLLDIAPGGNNNPVNLNFFLPGFGYVGAISCQNDNGLGRIVVKCANNGFFTTNRIQTQEIACSNGSGIYSNSYKFTPGNKNFGWVESDGGRVVSFDKVNLGTTGATWKVDWVWVADIGRYCLATVT